MESEHIFALRAHVMIGSIQSFAFIRPLVKVIGGFREFFILIQK